MQGEKFVPFNTFEEVAAFDAIDNLIFNVHEGCTFF
jgi:hypothetical protein